MLAVYMTSITKGVHSVNEIVDKVGLLAVRRPSALPPHAHALAERWGWT